MEAECARADLEFLRQDVWDKVRPGSFRRNKFLSALIAFSRPAFLALLIILLAVVPISREIPAPAVKYDRSKIVLAEPVIIIREDKDGKGTVIDMNAPPVDVNPDKDKSEQTEHVFPLMQMQTGQKAQDFNLASQNNAQS